MSNFQAAAVSYFGLPEGTVLIPSDPGLIAFHVELSQAVLAGIAERMAALAKAQDEKAVAAPFVPNVPLSELRARYNALSKEGKALYGSFGRYAKDCDVSEDAFVGRAAEPAPHPLRAEWDSMLPHQRTLIGSFEEYCAMRALRDEPEEKPLDIKWIAAAELTDEQIRGAMGEHAGKYAIQVDNLTDAQRAAL